MIKTPPCPSRPVRFPLARLLAAIFLLGVALPVGSYAAGRSIQKLDNGWWFARGEVLGAEAPGFAAIGWQSVTVPHDWSIGLPVDPTAPAAGHGGFYSGGIGWYRRAISVPQGWRGRRVAIEFEGAYQNAEVWLNGESVGRHFYGYTPFQFDLTSHLKFGADNILSVRLDNSAQPNARWYTGSGLYRPVRLLVTNPVQVDASSVWVATTELTERRAALRVESVVRNDFAEARTVKVGIAIIDPRGQTVAKSQVTATIAAKGEFPVVANLEISNPLPWTPESPSLYRVAIQVRSALRTFDEVSTPFGVRTVRVSAEKGFELNGRTVKFLGGNLHHDHGVLGAAAFDRAEERKVELLKAAGFNAVRTAHNPPSAAFLEACDRLGLLVMDEIFDGWEKPKTAHDYGMHFKEHWAGDVGAWVRRDRRHPSVVLWSTGNEMDERGSASGQRIAQELVAAIRALDSTRPVTAGVNGLGKSGTWTQLDPLFAAFDVAGYNYELAHHAEDHARLPARVIMAAESYQSEVFANWSAMKAHPYVIGDFVWSALDYLGEAGIGRVFPPDKPANKHWEAMMYPWHAAYCGDIDLTGWRKPASHYRNIVWDRGEKLYAVVLVPTPENKPWNLTPWSMPPALPSWTWPAYEGDALTVEVYSRHPAVRVTLNGRVLGEKPTTEAEEFKAVFAVPYESGELLVSGLNDGREVEKISLKTADEPVKLRLAADRTTLRADGQDLAFVTVEAIDGHGVWHPAATPEVTFSVQGPGTLAGAGTGDSAAMEGYSSPKHFLHQGRALAVVQAGSKSGKITLLATSPGMESAQITLESTRSN